MEMSQLKPVEWAVFNGNLNTLKFFVEEQHYDVNLKGFEGKTLLHWACEGGHLDVVKYLIDVQQLDPSSEDDNKETPLYGACGKGHLDIVRYLVNEQSVDPDYYTGWGPLHIACSRGHLEIVKFLVDEWKSDYTKSVDYNTSVLHVASIRGRVDIARYFIEEKQFDPMCKTTNNHTPLYFACQQGHLDLVKYLVNEKSINPLHELNDGIRSHMTPFHVACENGHFAIVKFLVEEKGCDPMHNYGKFPTPYTYACAGGHLELIRYFTEKKQCDPGSEGFNLAAASDQGKEQDASPVLQQKKYPQETHSSQSSSDKQSLPPDEPPLLKRERMKTENEAPPPNVPLREPPHQLKNEAPPPNVPLREPPHQLNPDDLAFLVNHLQPMASHWRPFGLQLGLLSGDLDTIAATPLLIPGGPPAYLEEVLKRWMNRAPPSPTLSKLCDSLRSCAVDQSRIALELEQQYQTWKTAKRWDEDPELKSLVRKAEPTDRQLGAGAYGSVEQVSIEGEMYAAKKLTVKICMNPNEFYKKFFSEFRILSSLCHPNIVQYQCVCPLPKSESPALVMEQLQTNLHDYLLNPSYANLSLDAKVSILHDIAKGLAYLHNHRPAVIHRDLSAKNILLSSDRVAKISDFGNSRIIDIDPACSSEFKSTTHVPGTIIYMPPEACSDHGKFNEKLDIFSFGQLALFTATQVYPCDLLPVYDEDRSCFRTEVERRQKYIDQLEQQLGGDHDLIKVIKQCLHNSSRMRPTADEIISVLEQLLNTPH